MALEALLKRVSTYSVASRLFNRGASAEDAGLRRYIREEIAKAYQAKSGSIGYDTGRLHEALTTVGSRETALKISSGVVEFTVDHDGAYWWGRRGNLEKVVPDIDMAAVLSRAVARFLEDRK